VGKGIDATTGLPAPGESRTLYVVDISGYVFRAYHALPPLTSSRGEPTHAVLGVTSMLLKLIEERRPAMLAVAMDSRTKPFRHGLYGEYKANRPPAPPDLKQQMKRVGEVVSAFPIPVFQQDGMEADDVIATLVRLARGNDINVVVVSADKDLLQLVGAGVWMYDTRTDRVFGPVEAEKKMGVPPAKIRDYLALVGDSSDNIPGVPSIGPKTAAALLSEYDDLDDLYRNLENVDRKALRARLTDNRESAYLSRRLVTLRDDVDLSFDEDRLVLDPTPGESFVALLRELEFTRLAAKFRDRYAGGDLPEDGNESSAFRHEFVRSANRLESLVATIKVAERVAIYSEYDRATRPDATLLGLSFAPFTATPATPPGPSAYFVPLETAGREAVAGTDAGRTMEALRPLLEDAELPKVCSDSKRDTVALSRFGVELRGVEFDTMLASYLLDPERRAHALPEVARRELGLELAAAPAPRGSLFEDAETPATPEATEGLAELSARRARAILDCAKEMEPRLEEAGCVPLMREIELPLSRVLGEMEQTGIRVDRDHLAAVSRQVRKRMVRIEARCKELAGRDFNVASPRQLEIILFDELELPVIKKTKSARSTDRESLEELAVYHDLPRAVLEYRSLAKLENTYLDALPRQIDPGTGRIHTVFNQVVTATGRLSSSDPNLQNIPVRTELGRTIRHAFIPRDGWEIISSDYSQIELRILAHLSGDPELTEAFENEEDVHLRTARAIFGLKASDEVTREMRGQAKTVNYAVIYGQTQFALARTLRIDRPRAGKYIESFFRQYAGVDRFMREVVEQAAASGFVRTLYGRRRYLPDLGSSNRVRRQQAERMARNTPIQGSAADIIKLAMIAIHREMKRRRLRSRMLLTVHDELVFETPPEEREKLAALVREKMEGAMKLSVPLVVDQGWGASWGEAH
jgi:DNA polymerase-1